MRCFLYSRLLIKPDFRNMSSTTVMLSDSRVLSKDRAVLEEKVAKLVTGGPSKLQLIFDFDYTMSRAHKAGVPVDCSWGVLENYADLPSSYTEKVKILRNQYYPIEIDPSISIEEKIPHMSQWYTKANLLLAESKVKADWFPRMVAQSNCELRDSTEVLLQTLHQSQIPLLVLSAGVGDLIKQILDHFNVFHDNIKIVSNFLEFDAESGAALGLKTDPCIHMFNKKAPSQEGLEQRKNIILIGDSLGDLRMADGIEDVNVVLSIGFLDKNVEANLPVYLDAFDVVLVDDQTMNFPIAVIEDILRTNIP